MTPINFSAMMQQWIEAAAIHEAAADGNPDRVKNHDRRVAIAAAYIAGEQASAIYRVVDELRAASPANQSGIAVKAGDLARLILSMQELEPLTDDWNFLNGVAVMSAKQLLTAIGSKPEAPQDR